MAESNPPDVATPAADDNINNDDEIEIIVVEDEIETKLGIQEYLSSKSIGFTAVVKARYSDFVVHEIDLNGNIAKLTSIDLPPSSSDKVVADENEEEKTDEKVTLEDNNQKEDSTLEMKDLDVQLAALINDKDGTAKKVITLLDYHDKQEDSTEDDSEEDTSSKMEKFVVLPNLEKTQRTAVHQWIRGSLKNARADTLDGRIRIWHAKFETEMPNFKSFGTQNRNTAKKRFKASWPKDRPDYLRFVLYKENLDTTTATKELSRRGSKARIGYAGMKDKRGITTQFCTLYKTTPEQIVNGKQQQQQQKGGGGNTNQKGYSVVTVGNFEFVSKELQLGMLKGNRFDIILRNVKTFKTNDDGTKSTIQEDDKEKQRQILEEAAKSMKDKGFINYFGTQRFGKFNDTHLVGIAVLQGDFRKAIDIMMSIKPGERPDIAQARKDWQERFHYGESKDNEAMTAKRCLKKFNRFMTGEIAVVQCLAKYPMDYKRAFSCIPKNLRMMYIHAVQSLIWNRATSYRIANMDSDNVMVGDLVSGAGMPGGDKFHIVTEEDIQNKKYTMEDVVVPLVGKKTIFPTNELLQAVEKIMDDIGISVKMFKTVQDNDRALVINGDYRAIICHPKDFDYSIKEYYHPLQPLLQTDLMKLQGEEITIEPQQDGESVKLGMIVGFTLPSSAYATIALRELMKVPTSNEFQKEVSLE